MEWRLKHDASVSPTLVRVSVGLEDAADLVEDVRQALAAAQRFMAAVEGAKPGAA